MIAFIILSEIQPPKKFRYFHFRERLAINTRLLLFNYLHITETCEAFKASQVYLYRRTYLYELTINLLLSSLQQGFFIHNAQTLSYF